MNYFNFNDTNSTSSADDYNNLPSYSHDHQTSQNNNYASSEEVFFPFFFGIVFTGTLFVCAPCILRGCNSVFNHPATINPAEDYPA